MRVLRRLGHAVTVPDGTTCCGQPAWNGGQAEAAAKVARTTLDALAKADADVVVVPAGSCATMIRVFWPELFEVVGDAESRARAEAVKNAMVAAGILPSRILVEGKGFEDPVADNAKPRGRLANRRVEIKLYVPAR